MWYFSLGETQAYKTREFSSFLDYFHAFLVKMREFKYTAEAADQNPGIVALQSQDS